MVEDTSYAAPRSSTRLQLGGASAAHDQPLLWAHGVLLGFALAATVVTLSLSAARVLLTAPLAAVRVRLDITEIMAEAVTGHFGSREQIVAIYTLREIRPDSHPASHDERRAIFNLSANTRAFGLFTPLTVIIAPGSAVYVDVRLFALDAIRGDVALLETDPGRAVASGSAVLVGCITHTLTDVELDTIRGRGSGYDYNRLLPGVCTTGAALPMTASPYRVSYRVEMSSAQPQ
jgi:hypothetical protein